MPGAQKGGFVDFPLFPSMVLCIVWVVSARPVTLLLFLPLTTPPFVPFLIYMNFESVNLFLSSSFFPTEI